MANKRAQRLISDLGMQKHPEGGYFAEVYKCSASVSANAGSRALASSIYYLLPAGEVSRFHRLKSDELWYYHAGDPLAIHLIDPSGQLTQITLGADTGKGEIPQAVIPAGYIFGATAKGALGYSLVGCMVCPGFEYMDFELLEREQLLTVYPQYKEIIAKLT